MAGVNFKRKVKPVLTRQRRGFLIGELQYANSDLKKTGIIMAEHISGSEHGTPTRLKNTTTTISLEGNGDSPSQTSNEISFVNLSTQPIKKCYLATVGPDMSYEELKLQLSGTAYTHELETLRCRLENVLKTTLVNKKDIVNDIVNPQKQHNYKISVWLAPPVVLAAVTTNPGFRPARVLKNTHDSASSLSEYGSENESFVSDGAFEDDQDLSSFGY